MKDGLQAPRERPHRRRGLPRAVTGACVLFLAASALAAPAPSLQQKLESIARDVPGTLGVAVLDLDRGNRVAFRGDQPAPMASVFKLPLAIAVLRRIQELRVAPSTSVYVRWDERNPGWSPLARLMPRGGLSLSLEELLAATVSESDNTAADALLRWMGGPQAVMHVIRRLGVGGIRIDRSERALALDLWGLQPTPKAESLEALVDRMEQVPKEQRLEAVKRFMQDPRDRATPSALIDLLSALQAGQLLDSEHTAQLLDLLRATRTGAEQLRAGLPREVTLAHKTGQIGGVGGTVLVLNDVGIASGNGRRIAIAVLLTDVAAPLERCQAIIAEVARTVWAELGASSPPDSGAPSSR